MKIHKIYIYFFFLGGGSGRGGGRVRGQGRCEQISEVFVKIQKKICFFWGGHRVDVNKELKFL